MKLLVEKAHKDAILPQKALNNADNAGYDLTAFMDEPIDLLPGRRCVVDTGIKMSIPRGYYGRVAPRSGLAVKHGIDVLAGVVDPGYTATIKVLLINLSDQVFTIFNGMRVAQLIITPCLHLDIQEVDELPTSVRGESGFGSTGLM